MLRWASPFLRTRGALRRIVTLHLARHTSPGSPTRQDIRTGTDASVHDRFLKVYGTLGPVAEPWNANIHYDRKLAAGVPAGATSALDVGCGDGFLAAQLAGRVPRVIALDIDADVLDRARARFPEAKVTWRLGDVLTDPLEQETFDAVVSNATLHHLPDTSAALHRLSRLVRPGGTLSIVGFTRTERRDLPWALLAFVSLGIAIRVRGKWEHTAPQAWPPPHTFRELRQTVEGVLPGARISRLVMGRYLIRWHAPASHTTNDLATSD
jgi:SAM-dependent methyltransferase